MYYYNYIAIAYNAFDIRIVLLLSFKGLDEESLMRVELRSRDIAAPNQLAALSKVYTLHVYAPIV